jgi:hypothetical protein
VNTLWIKLMAVSLLMVCGSAHAWDCNNPANWSLDVPGNECYHKGPNPNLPTGTTNENSQSQSQAQHQGQSQSSSNSNTNSNNASATNNGNAQTVITQTARQAPSVGQGSFAIGGCAMAGNAGGSNIHGSAFLGFAFTPEECYEFLLAQAYQAVGQSAASCDVLNHLKAAERAAKKGVRLPDCYPPPAPPEAVVAPTPQVTEKQIDDLNQKVDNLSKAVVKTFQK